MSSGGAGWPWHEHVGNPRNEAVLLNPKAIRIHLFVANKECKELRRLPS